MRMLCQLLQVTPGKTRQDGLISIDETSCIGLCDQGASLLVNGVPIPALDPEKSRRSRNELQPERLSLIGLRNGLKFAIPCISAICC